MKDLKEVKKKQMCKQVVIIGAGGHAKVIAEMIILNKDKIIGFLDDNQELQGKNIYSNNRVIGTIKDIGKYKDYEFIIGIGNNEIRKKIALDNNNLNWYKIAHPSSIFSSDIEIGEGTVIMPGAIINPGTVIGKHCIINTGAIIEHDNQLEDYVHISPNATLCGTVKVGESTHIGASATIKNNINITSNCVIGAGAVVVKNIEEEGTYVGVPAKLMKG